MTRFGRCRFYADENFDMGLVEILRDEGFHVDTACELGFQPRDDRFHLQEARARSAVLLTHDLDFLSHRAFPFHELKNTAIVIVRTTSSNQFGWMVASILDTAHSGNRNLYGLKIEVKGPVMTLHARLKGQIVTDRVDLRSPIEGEVDLFTSSE